MRRKGLGKSKGQGYKNILGNDSGIHSMSSKDIKQPMSMNESRLDSMDKSKKELSDYDKSEIVREIYDDEATRSQAYLLSDDDSGVKGHKTELPYYIEENDIEFDSNASSNQEEMNNAMGRLLEKIGLTLNDLKDDLEFSWNAESDSYLSFASAEVYLPKNNLPIFHSGSSDDAEIQIEDIEEEYKRHNFAEKGISLNEFKKILEDDFSLKNNLLYSPVNYSSVISIPRKEFIKIVKESGKKVNKEDLDVIIKYNNE